MQRAVSVFVPEKNAQARAASLLLAQKSGITSRTEVTEPSLKVGISKKHGKPYTWKKVAL